MPEGASVANTPRTREDSPITGWIEKTTFLLSGFLGELPKGRIWEPTAVGLTAQSEGFNICLNGGYKCDLGIKYDCLPALGSISGDTNALTAQRATRWCYSRTDIVFVVRRFRYQSTRHLLHNLYSFYYCLFQLMLR